MSKWDLPYRAIALQPRPREGVVTATPDGAYYYCEGERAQVVVVGRMHFTPLEYQMALCDLLQEFYEITSCEFMSNEQGGVLAQITWQRGFVSIMLQRIRTTAAGHA